MLVPCYTVAMGENILPYKDQYYGRLQISDDDDDDDDGDDHCKIASRRGA